MIIFNLPLARCFYFYLPSPPRNLIEHLEFPTIYNHNTPTPFSIHLAYFLPHHCLSPLLSPTIVLTFRNTRPCQKPTRHLHMAREKSVKDIEKEAEAAANTANYFTPKSSPSGQRPKLLALLAVETLLAYFVYTNYDKLNTLHPLLGPIILGACTAALAQTFNQYIKHQLIFHRIAKFITWGALNGLFTALWIEFVFDCTDVTVYRVLIDQGVGAPGFQLLFNLLNSFWEHGEVTTKTRNAFFRSLRWSYCFWPAFLVLAFGFLDPQLVFPANCVATLVWNLILSKLA